MKKTLWPRLARVRRSIGWEQDTQETSQSITIALIHGN